MVDPATRPYRIELPNLIDDSDLSVYAFRLYVHIKRVAGPDGTCYEGTRAYAERCKMAVGKVSEAKQELLDKGLIVQIGERSTRGGMVPEYKPVDMWAENFKTYARESVHVVNTKPQSVHESVQDVNTDDLGIEKPKTEYFDDQSVHESVHESVHHVNGRKNSKERTVKKERESAQPRTPPPPKQGNLDSLHEGVAIYKRLTGKKTVTPAVASSIADTVIDFAFWSTVVAAWCKRYRPENVSGMLDWYLHPDKMERSNGNGLGEHQAQSGSVVRNGQRQPANAIIPSRPVSRHQAEYERQYNAWLDSDSEQPFKFDASRL